MTNLEKYKDKIIEELDKRAYCLTVLNLRKGKNNSLDDCVDNRSCKDCIKKSLEWLTQEYTEPKKDFTQEELAVLRSIDKKWKWIARDEDGELYVYDTKPYKASDCWIKVNFQEISLFNCFKQIQWEDSEPVFIDDYVKR